MLTVRVCSAQDSAALEQIASSQAGSSPLLFTVKENGRPTVNPETFYHEKECVVRNGLPNFFQKTKRGRKVTVAFIGGSITQGSNGYRMQVAQYLQTRFPEVDFNWVNAGVSGTGTDLGAFRIGEHILRYQPDLVFIEFAVNGAYPPGMEGMIRQIIKSNPHTDICLIYTVMNGQTAVYQRGDVPTNILGLERIASHYRIPSIHMAMEAAALEAQDKLIWKREQWETGNRMIFSEDGIHPLEAGGNLYAAAIARGLKKMAHLATPRAHALSNPLTTDAWDAAGMYAPEDIAVFDTDWSTLATATTHLKRFEGWFEQVMTADKTGASFTFVFEGDRFGIFDIGGPEVGQLSVWVDGQPVALKEVDDPGYRLYQIGSERMNTTLNRFNKFCNNRYRGQYDVIELPWGKHKVTFEIASEKADKRAILGPKQLHDITENPEKYDRSAIYLGKILLRGRPLKNLMTDTYEIIRGN